jgi:cell division septation protein DedD
MKGMKILAAAAGIVVLAAVVFWWIQKKRAEEQAARSALIVSEQPLVSASPAEQKPPQTESQLAIVAEENGSFTVQISSWRSEAKAEQEAERFRGAGYAAYVQRAYLPGHGGVWYRVRVGQFRGREEAERQARDLEAQLEAGYWITQKQ